MVKQQQKKDKKGGSVELGAVATPVVLYGLRSLLTPNKKDKKETAGGKKQYKSKGGEGLANLGELVKKSMEGTVTSGLLNTLMPQQPAATAPVQAGGKRRSQRKQRGGEGEDMPEMIEGGKRRTRKQRGGEGEDMPEMIEGGKRRRQRKQRGGEDMPPMDYVAMPEVPMEGGKRRKARKQRGGEDMPPMEESAMSMEGGKRRRQRKQRGGEGEEYFQDTPAMMGTKPAMSGAVAPPATLPAVPPRAPMVPPAVGMSATNNVVPPASMTGQQKDILELSKLLQASKSVQQAAPAMTGGKKKKYSKKGGALDQYARQLEKISTQLSKLMQ